MPSTVLLIMLVVVWLFVLGPLVINSRDQIRRTNDALGQTRILHRGGNRTKARRRMQPLPGEQVGPVDAIVEEDNHTEAELFAEESNLRYVRGAEDSFAHEVHTERYVGEDSADADEILDVDVVDDEADTAEAPTDQWDTADYGVYENSTDFLFVADEDGQPLGEVGSPEPSETGELQSADTTETDVEHDAEPAATDSVDRGEGEDTVDVYDDEEVVTDPEELSDADLAFAEKRRGRGGFDPVADRRYSSSRYQRRQRTLLGLVGVSLAAIIVAFFSPLWAWAIPAVTVLVTVGYVVMLRQVTLAERSLRRRRIQQMRRARMGVETSLQREFEVTPAHLRRPGAVVVEVDDEDPIFDALDEYEAPYGYTEQPYYRSA